SWFNPASPPRNSTAPMMLMAMKENATGMPMNSRTVEPPNRSSEAICHDMGRSIASGRRNGVLARASLREGQSLHAEYELDGQQGEGDRHRRQQPPFGQHQRFDGD